MPPKIRSPTPSSSDGEPPAAASRAPISLKLNAPKQPPVAALPPLPPLPALPGAGGGSDDELSSLADSEDDAGDGGAAGSEDESVEEEPSDEVELEEEEEDEEDEYDDELDELEDDEEEEVYNPKATPRQAAMNQSHQAVPGSSGVKIKFKLGGSGGAIASAGSSSKGGASAKGSARKASSKAKSKKRARSYSDSEEDEDEEQEMPDELMSDESEQSGARLTFRQRAKELGGEHGIQFESLSNEIVTKGPKLTAAEIELRRQEVSRKRKSQSDARLEEEKTETINRLLNKNAQKRGPGGRLKKPVGLNVSGAMSDDENAPKAIVQVKEVTPTMSRWISSTKSGDFAMRWMTPLVGDWPVVEAKSAPPSYPPPRPPPKTRTFDKPAADAMVIG